LQFRQRLSMYEEYTAWRGHYSVRIWMKAPVSSNLRWRKCGISRSLCWRMCSLGKVDWWR
jgi:hypothetical protein